MADRNLTLFELHFDGGFQVGPKTIGVGGESDEDDQDDEGSTLLGFGGDESESATEDADEADDQAEADPDSVDEGGSPTGVVVGLLLLVLAAAVARYLRGDDEDVEVTTADELEDDVEEFESAD